MDQMKRLDQRADYENIEDGHSRDSKRFEVRYWGKWNVPDDVDDDEAYDYDWEELDEEWAKKLSKIISAVNKKYKGLKLSFGTSEKNWIDVVAK